MVGAATRRRDGSQGNLVAIKYSIQLEDGTVVDDTLGRSIMHTVGDKSLVSGIHLACVKMGRGAKAVLTIAPKYGYGDRGSAELAVPPKATLTVTLEVVDWSDVLDLTLDGGVMMSSAPGSNNAVIGKKVKAPQNMASVTIHHRSAAAA